MRFLGDWREMIQAGVAACLLERREESEFLGGYEDVPAVSSRPEAQQEAVLGCEVRKLVSGTNVLLAMTCCAKDPGFAWSGALYFRHFHHSGRSCACLQRHLINECTLPRVRT